VQPPGGPGAGLVEVGDLGGGALRADRVGEPAQLQPGGGLGRKPGQHPGADRHAQRLRQQLRGPLHRQVLAHPQVGRQRPHPRAIARRRARLGGKPRRGDLPAATQAPLRAVLSGPQPHLGQVEDLSGLHPGHRRQRQVPAAPLARHRPVDDNLVRLGGRGQVRTGRARLLAGLATASVSCPLPPGRRRLAQPIRRRRLRRVPRVPGELAFQLRHPRLERLDHQGLLGVDRPQLHNDRRLGSNHRTKIKLRIGGQVTASGTSSGHARLPMGLRESYPTTPHAVNPRPQRDPGPEQLHLNLFLGDTNGQDLEGRRLEEVVRRDRVRVEHDEHGTRIPVARRNARDGRSSMRLLGVASRGYTRTTFSGLLLGAELSFDPTGHSPPWSQEPHWLPIAVAPSQRSSRTASGGRSVSSRRTETSGWLPCRPSPLSAFACRVRPLRVRPCAPLPCPRVRARPVRTAMV